MYFKGDFSKVMLTWWSWVFVVKRLILASLTLRAKWTLQAVSTVLYKVFAVHLTRLTLAWETCTWGQACCLWRGAGSLHVRLPLAHGEPHSWINRGWGHPGKHSHLLLRKTLQPTTVVTALKKLEKFIWIHKSQEGGESCVMKEWYVS